MTHKFMGLALSADIPEEDDVVHTSGGDIFAGGMEIEGHDGLFVSFEGADEARVLFVMHECILNYRENITFFFMI